MQSEGITPSFKELEQLKLSPSTKVLLLINLPQKTLTAVSIVEITVTKKTIKVPSINYPYFAKLFKFFVVKLKLLRKQPTFCFWVLQTSHWCQDL